MLLLVVVVVVEVAIIIDFCLSKQYKMLQLLLLLYSSYLIKLINK